MNKRVRTSLHELIEEPISGARPKGGVTYEGDIPSFGGENVTLAGGLDFYPVKKVSSDFYCQMKRGHLCDLDVVINKDGANTGKSAIYRKSPYTKACINEHLFILRGGQGKLNQVYLHYLLQSPEIKKTLQRKITGSAQPGLNSSFCRNFPVAIVSLPEQKKIAIILTSVDEVIENTQKQIDKLQDLKKATMQELLTKGIGHTKFKDTELGRIPQNWKVRKINDICLIDPLLLKETTCPNYRFRYIDISSVSTGVIHYPTETIAFSEAPSRARKVIRKGNVLIGTVRPNLKAFTYFDANGEDWIASTGFAVLQANQKINSRFLFNLMLSDNISLQIEKMMIGSNYPAINSSDVKALICLVPPLSEQKQIASILTAMDDRIEVARSKLSQTQSLKQSLMQDLLAGKVRVSST